MMSALLALLLAAHPAPRKPSAPPSAPLIKDGELTREGLVALSTVAESIPKADPFKPEKPRSRYADAKFSFIVLFAPADRENNEGATWRYDLPSETLTLSYSPPSFAGGHGAQLRFVEKQTGTYTGKTAMGARARVRAYVQVRQGVKFTAEPSDGTAKYGAPSYTAEVKVPPERGRALVAKMGVVIAGVTTTSEEGHVSSCDDDHDGATITDPTDLYTRTCATLVDVRAVRFISTAADAPLAEWPKSSEPKPLPSTVAATGTTAGLAAKAGEWAQIPTPDQLGDAYPDRAQRLGKSGSATLSCTVAAGGILKACSVVSETPPDYGFGAAAQKLMRYFRRSVDAPVGEQVSFPINFTVPKSP